jgi:hypothetical protein
MKKKFVLCRWSWSSTKEIGKDFKLREIVKCSHAKHCGSMEGVRSGGVGFEGVCDGKNILDDDGGAYCAWGFVIKGGIKHINCELDKLLGL